MTGAAGGNLKVALYTDNAGNPDQLIVQGSTAITTAGRYEVSVPQTTLAAGTYWIMYVSDAALPINRDNTTVTDNARYIIHTYADPLPATIVSPTIYSDRTANDYLRGFVIP